jgi:hypothetical protein
MRVSLGYILLAIAPILAINIEPNKQYNFLQDETAMSLELLITENELALMKDFLIIEIESESFPAPSITAYTVRHLLSHVE